MSRKGSFLSNGRDLSKLPEEGITSAIGAVAAIAAVEVTDTAVVVGGQSM